MTKYGTFINYSENSIFKFMYPLEIIPHTQDFSNCMWGGINVIYSASNILLGNVVFKQFIIPTDWDILLQMLLACVFQVRLLFIIRPKKWNSFT